MCQPGSSIKTRSEEETELQNDSCDGTRAESQTGSSIERSSQSSNVDEENQSKGSDSMPRVKANTDTQWEGLVRSDPCFSSGRQEALRVRLGMASPEMVAMIQQTEFVSLGSHCRVAMTLENMGLRKCAYPFDYVRSSAEGVLQCLETDFADFFSFAKIERGGSSKFFFHTSWGGSFWHHDIEDDCIRDSFVRRIDRLICGRHLEGLATRIFVRVANSPQELVLAPKLLATLQRKTPGVCVKLLVLIDMQKFHGLLRVQNTSSNLLFYRVHEDLWLNAPSGMLEERHHIADTYAVGIAAALRYWAHGHRAHLQAAVVRDFTVLNACVAHFEGGDCNTELYRPQRLKEPRFLCLPQGATSGDHVKTRCFGMDVVVEVPPGCSPGQKLELRLMENMNNAVRVRLASAGGA